MRLNRNLKKFYALVMNCVERRKRGEVVETYVVERANKGCDRSEKESV